MEYKQEYLGYNFIWFMGVVEDRLDPLKMGRVRVRCFNWHSEDKERVPTATSYEGSLYNVVDTTMIIK